MYGKIVDGKLEIVKNKIKTDNGWITNPTEKQLKDNGYKEIVYQKEPEFDIDTEKINEQYLDDKTQIIVSYCVTKLTNEEFNERVKFKIYSEISKISVLDIVNAIIKISNGSKSNEELDSLTEIKNTVDNLNKSLKEVK